MPELPAGEARRALLLRYGQLVASLGGTYHTAGDMNITPADLDVMHERLPLGVRHDRRRRQQRPRHRARRAARHPREHRARLRLARPRRAHACSSRAWAPSVTISRATSSPKARPCSSPTSTSGAPPSERRDGCSRRRRRGRALDRVRRLCAVRGRRHAERRHDPAPALPHRRRLGEQPARRARRRGAPARRRHPLRARLRRSTRAE